jgi:hypothetical protein
VERRRAATTGRNPSRRGGQRREQGGRWAELVAWRGRSASSHSSKTYGGNRSGRGLAGASAGGGEGGVVGGRGARRRGDRPNRSGLTDRTTELVGSGRVDQAKVGWQGQMGVGLFSQIELSLT